MRSRNMTKKTRSKRRSFSDEYRAEVVRMCRESGKTAHAVARELGLTPSSVTTWVRQSKVDEGPGGSGPLTTAEREELATLRREVRTLRQEREILKRATAFFAKEGTP
jgi:transposase